MTRKSITTSKVRLILKFFLSVSLLIYIYSPHAKKQTYLGAKAAKFRSTSHHMISAAPSLFSIEYQLNLRRKNPTEHLTHQGNLKSQSFFSKINYLHTYVAMYSFSTESHMPRDMPFLIYDQYRYYHFFIKAREPHGKMQTQDHQEEADDSDDMDFEDDDDTDNQKDEDFSDEDILDEDEDEDVVTLSQLVDLVETKKTRKKRERRSEVGAKGQGSAGRGGGSRVKLDNRGRPIGSKNVKGTKASAAASVSSKSTEKTPPTVSSPGQSTLSFLARNPVPAQISPLSGTKSKKVTLPPMHQPSKTMKHAPQDKAMVERNESPAEDMVERTYTIRIQYRRKIESKSANAVELMKNLIARLIQYNTTVQMLPYEEKSDVNPLVSAKDIPTEVDEFKIYVPHSSIHPRSKVMRMSFRISSNMPMWKLKQVHPIRNYMDKYDIYLDQMLLTTTDNAKIGGLVMSHCQYTRRDEATQDLSRRINENETNITPIQLTPHTLWNNSGGQKISTKLLAVECARQHAREVKKRIFKKVINLPEDMEMSNTRYFNFMPFTASGAITNKVIRAGIYLQNRFLNDTTAVTMLKIKTTKWKVPNIEVTFKQAALQATADGNGSLLFTTVELGAGNNKVHLVTTKELLQDATVWADKFTTTMLEHNTSEAFWKSETGFDGPPERVGKVDVTDAHQAYANFIEQEFGKVVGKEEETTCPKMAPKKLSYSRVTYGPTEVCTTTSTQETATSTITSSESESFKSTVEEIKEDNKKTKNDILQQMQDMNQSANERVQRLEQASKDSDKIFTEIFVSNKRKQDEFLQYEQRLNQISEIGQSTASKVDKLSFVFKQFLQEMAVMYNTSSVNPPKQTRLLKIASLLDNDGTLKSKDTDDPSTHQSETITQPLPGEENALGGRGNQK